MNPKNMENVLLGFLNDIPVLPVLVLENIQFAVPLAKALVKGGLPVIEVTLRTSAALDIIKVMSTVPGAIVGAGSVITANDVDRVKCAGAAFGVSPGSSENILAAAEKVGLPLLPGAATATEIMYLMSRGFRFCKFFPASSIGGISALSALYGPFKKMTFCPTGGISASNAREYLSLENVRCVGGSWVLPQTSIQKQDWIGIERLVRSTLKTLI